VLVAINIGWSTWALKRAGAGVSGPAQRKRRAWIGVMLVAWAAAYTVTVPLYHARASHPVWALYPASAPLNGRPKRAGDGNRTRMTSLEDRFVA